MKDDQTTIIVFIVMMGFMVIKTLYFPCNCSVPPPASQVVEANQGDETIIPVGMVTMIDLGATECIPCKMMAPIIEELKKEYTDRADIIFIDVWKNPVQAKKYGIRAIPTQIFFDAAGKEVHRNTGFMDKNRIVEILTRLGVS